MFPIPSKTIWRSFLRKVGEDLAAQPKRNRLVALAVKFWPDLKDDDEPETDSQGENHDQ